MSVHRGHRATPGERQARRIEMADPNKGSHSPGWPHLDRHGHCLCFNSCCFGPGGNKCKEGRSR